MIRNFRIGLALSLIMFIIHLALINHYSINWDFHHVFFAGIYHLKRPQTIEMTRGVPFVEPDPRRMVETPFGPLQSFFPALSYQTFYEKLKILPFDSAFSLPAVVLGVLGSLILFIFLKQAFNVETAILGFIFLALFPRWFGDLHTNVKDVTTATLFAASIFFAWRFIERRKVPDLLTASLLTGITFNFKVNAIFIPVIIGLWVLFLLFTKTKKYLSRPFTKFFGTIIAPSGMFLILSSVFAFGIWSVFWKDPYNHFAYLIRFFQYNTINMEILLNGDWYCSGVNAPWFYPYWYLSVVTPLPVLILGVIGMIIMVTRTLKRDLPIAPLLLLWFFVPLLKYFSPTMGLIDGIRHFEEVVFPWIAFAAITGGKILNLFSAPGTLVLSEAEGSSGSSSPSLFTLSEVEGSSGNNSAIKQFNNWKIWFLTIGPMVFILLYLIYPIVRYHPYQLSYFNEIAGGLKGALGKYDIDYWGISQKEAVQWLNNNAPKNAYVHIIMSPDTAGKYLRPDLFKNLNAKWYDDSDFVVFLNRQSFFYRYLYSWEYLLRRKPVFTVERFGIPLAFVIDNKVPSTQRQPNWWKLEDPCIRKYWDSEFGPSKLK